MGSISLHHLLDNADVFCLQSMEGRLRVGITVLGHHVFVVDALRAIQPQMWRRVLDKTKEPRHENQRSGFRCKFVAQF